MAAARLALHDAGELQRVTDFGLSEAGALRNFGLRGAAAELDAQLSDAPDDELKMLFAARLLSGLDGPTRGLERADHRIDIDVGHGSRADGIADLVQRDLTRGFAFTQQLLDDLLQLRRQF